MLPDHRLHEVQKGEDLGKVCADAIADGTEVVVAAGGDGTLHEVVCGVGDTKAVTVGLIPLGTGNDLARSLHLPLDLPAAIAVIAAGRTREIDLVHVSSASGERWCVNASAGGFAGVVDEKLSHAKSGWLGPLAYFNAAVEALLDIPIFDLTLHVDDQPPFKMTGCNVVIGNGRSVAGGVVVAPDAVLDDGLVDVAIFRATKAADLALLVPKLMAGAHVDESQIYYVRCKRLTIESTPPAIFNSDGEIIGEGPVSYEVRHKGLRMLVP